MMKMLVFDMDGTIANLYAVDGWLNDLRSYKTRPYETAEPMYNMTELADLLNILKNFGWKIAVTSWLSKESTSQYDRAVMTAKLNWLNNYGFPYDYINLVPYGTSKTSCTRNFGGYQILVDDNKEVREEWGLGDTINANLNIIPEIIRLINAEL